MPQFGASSKKNLYECEQPLIDLFEEIVQHYDCSIIEGARSREEQDKLFHSGKSKLQWPNSKHNITGTQPKSLAVDVIPYPSVLNNKSIWEDLNRFYYFIGFVTGVAAEMDIPIRLGADWNGDRNLKQAFVDLPHVELVTDDFSQF